MKKIITSTTILTFLVSILYADKNKTLTPPIVYVAGDGSGDYNCDGKSDQIEINKALDFVATHPKYTTVHLKGSNTYWIDSTIYISSNTILEGDSTAIVKLIDNAKYLYS